MKPQKTVIFDQVLVLLGRCPYFGAPPIVPVALLIPSQLFAIMYLSNKHPVLFEAGKNEIFLRDKIGVSRNFAGRFLKVCFVIVLIRRFIHRSNVRGGSSEISGGFV